MKAYRTLLVLLALTLVAAIAAWAIGSDPGYVLVQRGEWVVESTLVFTVIALLVVAALALGTVALLRWPVVAMQRRRRRDARVQLERGALALAEGRTQRAETAYLRAAKLPSLRIPALLGAREAASLRGDAAKRDDITARLAAIDAAGIAAAVLRAERELVEGRAGAAIEMLTELERTERLPPAGARTLVEALVARGRAREALGPLSRLRRGQVMSDAAFDRFEATVLAQALEQASDAQSLRALWAELNRNQRRDPAIALAYAHRAAPLKLADAADELLGVLRKHWCEPLAARYATLAGDPAERLRVAEALLREHPDSAGLHLTLGRLCADNGLWGKSEAYLQRALALGASGATTRDRPATHPAPESIATEAVWEALGRTYAMQGDYERSSRAYANAFAVARGEAPQVVTPRAGGSAPLATLAIAEERDAHGVPRLPAGISKD